MEINTTSWVREWNPKPASVKFWQMFQTSVSCSITQRGGNDRFFFFFRLLISLPSWEKVFHNIPTTSKARWQTDRAPRTKAKNLSNLRLRGGIYYHLDTSTKTIVQRGGKKEKSSTLLLRFHHRRISQIFLCVRCASLQFFGSRLYKHGAVSRSRGHPVSP